MKTTNNRVLITGGGSGIGLALAQKFLTAGNEVIIAGRDMEKLTAVQQAHPQMHIAATDLTNLNSLQQLVNQHPDINILINNAGVQFNYDFADSEAPLDLIEREIETNVTGLMQLTKLYLPHLQSQTDAAIINVSSALGVVPKEDAPVYCASKAAVHIFSKSLRWQLEASSVRVFEIIPALVDTPMTNGRHEQKISPEALVMNSGTPSKKISQKSASAKSGSYSCSTALRLLSPKESCGETPCYVWGITLVLGCLRPCHQKLCPIICKCNRVVGVFGVGIELFQMNHVVKCR